jgi:glycosyltransferase involved in cell wall biosynthesis
MKLLFLCKRHPQGRDLLTRPYGRFYQLPRFLAQKGHEVSILLCSYKRESNQNYFHDENGIHWYSVGIADLNPFRYYRTACQLAEKIDLDWIIGFSDTYYGILADHLARRFGCRSLIDAYDNYESYISWMKPLHALWRRSLAKATIVTAAGPNLAELLGNSRPGKRTSIIPMTADPIFKPLDKIECRKRLGLSINKKLIGYCGSLHPNRGINILFDEYRTLAQERTNIQLILSGRKSPKIDIPEGANWLGFLPDEEMPLLLNSMDVLTVTNQHSSFGNFSYPVKLYEAMCCQVPVIATATPATQWILKSFPDFLVTLDDSLDLRKKILQAMEYKKFDYGHQQSWEELAFILENNLENISSSL